MSDLVNLNTAKLDELTALPGVGKALAQRIVANRPYQHVEELQNVSGIGVAAFERLSPLIHLGDVLVDESETNQAVDAEHEQDPAPEEEVDALAVDTEIPEDGLSPEQEIAQPEPEIETPPEQKVSTPKEKTVTRGRVWLYSLVTSFFAFVLALVVTLGIVAGINGGLTFARPAQISALNREIQAANAQMEVLRQDVEGLHARLANLEGVGERVDQIEREVNEVVQESDALVVEMETIRSEASQFQGFLDGLRELLSTLLESEPETP